MNRLPNWSTTDNSQQYDVLAKISSTDSELRSPNSITTEINSNYMTENSTDIVTSTSDIEISSQSNDMSLANADHTELQAIFTTISNESTTLIPSVIDATHSNDASTTMPTTYTISTFDDNLNKTIETNENETRTTTTNGVSEKSVTHSFIDDGQIYAVTTESSFPDGKENSSIL